VHDPRLLAAAAHFVGDLDRRGHGASRCNREQRPDARTAPAALQTLVIACAFRYQTTAPELQHANGRGIRSLKDTASFQAASIAVRADWAPSVLQRPPVRDQATPGPGPGRLRQGLRCRR
jgi:hypothetical protein